MTSLPTQSRFIGTWHYNCVSQEHHLPSDLKAILGYSPERVLQWKDLLAPAAQDKWQQDLERYLYSQRKGFSGKRCSTIRTTLRDGQGEEVQVAAHCSVGERDDGGTPIIVYCSVEQVHLTQREQKSILSALGSLVFVMDNDGFYTDYYAENTNLLWAKPESFLGHHYTEVLSPDVAAIIHSKWNAMLRSKKVIGFEYSMTINNKSYDFQCRISHLSTLGIVAVITDITPQKKELSRLMKEARLFESIVKAHSFYIIRTDLHGRYTYTNEHFRQTFVPVAQKALEKSVIESIYEEDQGIFWATVEKSIAHPNQSFQCTLRMHLHNNSRLLWTKWELVPITDPTGAVIEVQYLGVDITPRKELEEKLEQNSRTLESFSRQLPGMLLQISSAPDGRFIAEYISENCQSIIGFPAAILGLSPDPLSMIFGSHFDDIAAKLRKSAKEKTPCEFEFTRTMDGDNERIFKFQATAEVASDNTTFFFCYLQDITEEREKTKRMRQLAYIAEYTGNVVLITDTSRKIEWVNPKFTEVTGYLPEEAIGKSPGNILQGEKTNPHTVRAIRQALNQGRGFQGEILNYTKSGKEYWLEINIQPIIESDGSIQNFIALQTDITQRKREQQRLEESERNYRLIAENTSDGIIVFDSENKSTYISPSYKKMLGYNPDEEVVFDEQTVFDTIHPDDRTAVYEEIFSAVLRQETILTYNFRMTAPDGSMRWREDQAHFIYNQYGQLEHTYIIARDVTERQRRQEEIEFKNSLLSAILSSTPATHCVVDENLLITFLDKNLPNMTMGLPSLSVGNGMSLLAFLDQENSKQFRKDIEAAFNGKRFTRLQQFTRKRGSSGWRENTFSPLFDNEGNMLGVLLILQDVSEREEQQRLLQDWNSHLEQEVAQRTNELERQIVEMQSLLDIVQHKEQLISQIALSSPDVLYVYDLEQQKDIFSTRPLHTLLGYPTESSFKNLTVEALIHPDDKEKKLKMEEMAKLKDTEYVTLERRVKAYDGNFRMLRTRVTSFRRGSNGQPLQLFGVVSDVTEQRQTEAHLRHLAEELTDKNRQLQQVNAEKSEILGVVAHDLKNLISSVLLSADLIERHPDRLPTHKVQDLAHRIAVSALRMRQFVEQMLISEGLEQGTTVADIGEFNAFELLEEACSIYNEHLTNKHIHLRQEYTSRELPLLLVDGPKTVQIFDNLLSNCIKYSPRESSIVIATDYDAAHNSIRFLFKDSGKGIPLNEREHLFKRYHRLSTKPTGGESSSGLGLSIVKKLVDLLGGSIRYIDEEEWGAVFELILPCVSPNSSDA